MAKKRRKKCGRHPAPHRYDRSKACTCRHAPCDGDPICVGPGNRGPDTKKRVKVKLTIPVIKYDLTDRDKPTRVIADVPVSELPESWRNLKPIEIPQANKGSGGTIYGPDKGGRSPAFEGVIRIEDKRSEFGEEDVRRLLKIVGDDPTREGLRETPKRFLKACGTWFDGYLFSEADVARILKVFEDGAEGCDQLIVQKSIPVYSHCEHHIAPFFGVVHVGYLPSKRIVGLSKLKRVVDIYSHRLQVQERLANQIADALNTHLKPRAVGVIIECRHMCMESRGVECCGIETRTQAIRGLLLKDASLKAEFLDAVRGK